MTLHCHLTSSSLPHCWLDNTPTSTEHLPYALAQDFTRIDGVTSAVTFHLCDRQPTWQARARRDSSTEDGWQTREEWQASRNGTQRRGGRPSGGFDPLFDATQQTEYWEYRAAQIQKDAQRTARQAVRHCPLRRVLFLTQCLC